MNHVVQLLPDNPRVSPHVLRRSAAPATGRLTNFVLYRTAVVDETAYEQTDCTVCHFSDERVVRALQQIGDGDRVVVHYLTADMARLLDELDPAIYLTWCVFGAEFYSRPELCGLPMYLPLTRAMELERASALHRHKTRAAADGTGSWVGKLLPSARARTALLKRVMARVDVVATAFEHEYDMIKERVSPRAAWQWYTYYSIEDSTAQAAVSQDATRILVGNNAHPSNNHLDAVARLLADGHAPEQLLLPLAYGDADYRTALLAQLPRGIEVLTESMPLQDYLSLLRTCHTAVFEHRRQQAFGNVVAMLAQGSCVTLRNENAVAVELSKRIYGCALLSPENDGEYTVLSSFNDKSNSCIANQFSAKRVNSHHSNILFGSDVS